MAHDAARSYRRLTDAERIEIVERSWSGESQRLIARNMDLKRTTIRRFLQKVSKEHTMEDNPKCGRPTKLTDRTRRLLCRKVENYEILSASELVETAGRDYQVQLSESTAIRMLHAAGLDIRHSIRKPLLTDEHKRKRLEFANACKDWTVDDWKSVVFSDETIITALHMHPRKLIWTKTTDSLDPHLIVPTVQAGGAKIMTWGCISWNGFHDLVLHEDRVNAQAYIDALREYLLPIRNDYFKGQRFIFQQDGASIHTAGAVTEFFNAEDIDVLEWPPHSPDLNIIEHMWHYLKIELHKHEPAKNKQDLWNKVLSIMPTIWNAEMTEKIRNLFDSMPRRIQAVIAASGGNTKY
jgi:transposase